jgi:hypothetical protein
MLQSIVIGKRPPLTFNEYLCPGSEQTVPQLKMALHTVLALPTHFLLLYQVQRAQ